MPEIDDQNEIITSRIIFLGGAGAGKRTILKAMHNELSAPDKREIVRVTEHGKIFIAFDIVPLVLGRGRYRSRYRVQTLAEDQNASDLPFAVLKRSDGIYFVADSSHSRAEMNLSYYERLKHEIASLEIPIIFQYNKRDLLNAMSTEDMDKQFAIDPSERFEVSATEGTGLLASLKAMTTRLDQRLNSRPNGT